MGNRGDHGPSQCGSKTAARNSPVTPLPAYRIDTQATIEIGGKSIDVTYTGRSHSDSSLVVYYGERRISRTKPPAPLS